MCKKGHATIYLIPMSNDVDVWFAAYNNPQKEVMLKVRKIILETDDRIDECIKWSAPTFMFKGNLASFNPRSKQHASLLFHTGAQIPGEFPSLEGGAGTARYMKFVNMQDVEDKKSELEKIVKAWIALRDRE
jgi:hypothetical protein